MVVQHREQMKALLLSCEFDLWTCQESERKHLGGIKFGVPFFLAQDNKAGVDASGARSTGVQHWRIRT